MKKILLLGDSIRLGYGETVREKLSDVAEVVFPEENGRFTQYTLASLERWAQECGCDAENVAVVQFNCGHWDVAHFGGDPECLNSETIYGENIGRIIRKLRRLFPVAKLVFATTTTMNPNGLNSVNFRTNEEIERYNRIAISVCDADVLINDLNGETCEYGEEMYADYCHFTEEGFEQLGDMVAAFLRPLVE